MLSVIQSLEVVNVSDVENVLVLYVTINRGHVLLHHIEVGRFSEGQLLEVPL